MASITIYSLERDETKKKKKERTIFHTSTEKNGTTEEEENNMDKKKNWFSHSKTTQFASDTFDFLAELFFHQVDTHGNQNETKKDI